MRPQHDLPIAHLHLDTFDSRAVYDAWMAPDLTAAIHQVADRHLRDTLLKVRECSLNLLCTPELTRKKCNHAIEAYSKTVTTLYSKLGNVTLQPHQYGLVARFDQLHLRTSASLWPSQLEARIYYQRRAADIGNIPDA